MKKNKMTRDELATALAIDRAEYEVEHAGREAHWQPLLFFVREGTVTIAKRHPVGVRGVAVARSEVTSVYARVDWRKLAKSVEKRVPIYKRLIVEQQTADAIESTQFMPDAEPFDGAAREARA